MITHNVLHAFQVADRIVVLRHGRVTGERSVRSTTHEEIVSLITGGARRFGAAGCQGLIAGGAAFPSLGRKGD